MDSKLFPHFAQAIRNYDGNPLSPALLMARSERLSCYYAPFDRFNPNARVVLVGITPGRAQADAALRVAKVQLSLGASHEEALAAAKGSAAFAGPMRTNLIAMLDHIGLATKLGLDTCGALFGSAGRLVQTISVLPFPVFIDGKDYNGTPSPMRQPMLRQLMLDHFMPILKQLPEAVYVPLGPVPASALDQFVKEGLVKPDHVLSGLPHPAGANAERIAYFMGRKARTLLSAKTDPDKLEQARARLTTAVSTLPAGWQFNLRG